jgi:ribonuclease HII
MTVGIDEVGRGCWAGPLVVAAVKLGKPIARLTDSKVLSGVQREKFAQLIRQEAEVIAIAWIAPLAVDELGLTAAMRQACQSVYTQLEPSHTDEIIIDGSINYLPGTHATALIKADLLIPAVSAASIIAKVARDHYMRRIAEQFPGYGFDRHVGYGTSQHITALDLHGPCAIHRHSFKPVHSRILLSSY